MRNQVGNLEDTDDDQQKNRKKKENKKGKPLDLSLVAAVCCFGFVVFPFSHFTAIYRIFPFFLTFLAFPHFFSRFLILPRFFSYIPAFSRIFTHFHTFPCILMHFSWVLAFSCIFLHFCVLFSRFLRSKPGEMEERRKKKHRDINRG